MSRPIAKKCKHCSTLSTEDAKVLHGSDGDNCWNPTVCHRRRSHYRHRDDINRIRRRIRRNTEQSTPNRDLNHNSYEEICIPVDRASLAAVLVLYRQTKQSPVHAIAAEVWQGTQKIGGVAAVHCMGMRGNQVTNQIHTMLTTISNTFGISRFEDVIKELPVESCPIDGCPLQENRHRS